MLNQNPQLQYLNWIFYFLIKYFQALDHGALFLSNEYIAARLKCSLLSFKYPLIT